VGSGGDAHGDARKQAASREGEWSGLIWVCEILSIGLMYSGSLS
jgi:hypothetical protein